MIRKKEKSHWMVIDLTGPQGNAFFLLGLARNMARELNLDADGILEEMRTSDYENLVHIFDKHFGKYVILER